MTVRQCWFLAGMLVGLALPQLLRWARAWLRREAGDHEAR